MSLTIRFRRATPLALGAFILATATAGIANAGTVPVATHSHVQAGADTTWCTITPYEVVVRGHVIATTPQVGPIPCGP
jgi:hypothetical protein